MDDKRSASVRGAPSLRVILASFAAVQQFVTTVDKAESLSAITHVLGKATRALRFDHFALIQRVNARLPIGPIALSDYPDRWIERLGATAYYVHDPVLAACEKSAVPFAWDAIPTIFALSSHQKAYMADARAA